MDATDQIDPPLLVEDRGIYRKLIINRPRKANALNELTLAALEEAVHSTAKNEQIRLFEITGAGARVFCAGADLTEAGEQTEDSQRAQAFDARWDRVTAAIEKLPCITVAGVNGACVGGGLSIAIACDFRISSENAFFEYPAARHGFMPSPLDVQRLLALVGPAQARSILLLGRRKSAAEALQIGLSDILTPSISIVTTLTEMIQAVESGKPQAQLAIKRLLDSAPLSSSAVRDAYCAVYDSDTRAVERLRRR